LGTLVHLATGPFSIIFAAAIGFTFQVDEGINLLVAEPFNKGLDTTASLDVKTERTTLSSL
jgi:hypothetical protein